MGVLRVLVLLGVMAVLGVRPATAADNALTEEEKAQGWRLLFDGKTLNGWVPVGKPEAFAVVDGTLYCNGKGGHLIRTTERFKDFVLSVDFKISKGANSGIFVHWSDLNDWLHKSIEVQILDSYGKPPSRQGCASVYEYLAPSKNMCKPAGEWNTMVITCRGKMLTVEHNGEKVCEVDRDLWTTPHRNPDGSTNKFNYALKDLPREGYIALQDHGHEIWFRNIKIKPLP
ncbi:MAG: DUF1080 domain-containing protein [Armatimonadota bacterium]|nr:DUF1080 domain-containing protein [Armatimonadota bacterium]